MNGLKKSVVVAAGLLALAGCAQKAPPAVDTAADEAAVRAINPTWFKSYNAGDAAGVAALYADDAVLNAPGTPPARGRAAIQDYVAQDIAAAQAAGLKFNAGANVESGVSGDLAWEWNTFSVTDSSGATVDTGKYVTVYARRGGKWMIIRDIWNSDAPPAAAAPAAEAPAS
jgi:uncharacterized protein (TIGR02246 family)